MRSPANCFTLWRYHALNRETYFKNRKVFLLYSSMITCIIVGLFLHYGRLIFISDKISETLSLLFIFAGYILLLRIASRLKKKEIHGLSSIAWASYLLFMQSYASSFSYLWLEVIKAVTTIVLIYFLIDGIIRFIISLISRIRTAASSEEKTIDSIDTAVAVVTSLTAIIISIIEIC